MYYAKPRKDTLWEEERKLSIYQATIYGRLKTVWNK